MNNLSQTTTAPANPPLLTVTDLQAVVEKYKYLRIHSELAVSPKLMEYIKGLAETPSPNPVLPGILGVDIKIDRTLSHYDYRWDDGGQFALPKLF